MGFAKSQGMKMLNAMNLTNDGSLLIVEIDGDISVRKDAWNYPLEVVVDQNGDVILSEELGVGRSIGTSGKFDQKCEAMVAAVKAIAGPAVNVCVVTPRAGDLNYCYDLPGAPQGKACVAQVFIMATGENPNTGLYCDLGFSEEKLQLIKSTILDLSGATGMRVFDAGDPFMFHYAVIALVPIFTAYHYDYIYSENWEFCPLKVDDPPLNFALRLDLQEIADARNAGKHIPLSAVVCRVLRGVYHIP